LVVVLWNQASISNDFRDIHRRMWRSGSRDLKSPLNEGQGHTASNRTQRATKLTLACAPLLTKTFCTILQRALCINLLLSLSCDMSEGIFNHRAVAYCTL